MHIKWIWRSSKNWDIASHWHMGLPFPREYPDGQALNRGWQLSCHYGVPIWISWIDFRFAFGPCPVCTIIRNLKLERFHPLFTATTIPSSSCLNLAYRYDILERELIPLIMNISFSSPSLISRPCVIELTLLCSKIFTPYWRSRTSSSYGTPYYG